MAELILLVLHAHVLVEEDGSQAFECVLGKRRWVIKTENWRRMTLAVIGQDAKR